MSNKAKLRHIKTGRGNKAKAVGTNIELSHRPKDILEKLMEALQKPKKLGPEVFQSSIGRKVYVYAVDPKQPRNIIRTDAAGKQTVGRISGGRFRGLRPSK